MSAFKFNPTEVAPQTPVVVDASPNAVRKSKAPADDWWMNEPPGVRDYAEEARKTVSDPRSTLQSELSLLEEPRWMAGLWAVAKDTDGNQVGWRDARGNMLLTFNNARKLIEDRITELGLSADLIHQWPQSRGMSWQDYQAFWKLPPKERLQRFKKPAPPQIPEELEGLRVRLHPQELAPQSRG